MGSLVASKLQSVTVLCIDDRDASEKSGGISRESGVCKGTK